MLPIALLAAFWGIRQSHETRTPGSQRDALVAFYRENMPLFFRPKPGDADQEAGRAGRRSRTPGTLPTTRPALRLRRGLVVD